jgi:NitT/TauT family transport system substrate-binding protein
VQRRSFIRLWGTIPLAMVVPWVAGCASTAQWRVGIHPWIGYESLKLAQDFKWLPPGADLLETQDMAESSRALQTGHLDAACMTLDEVLRLRGLGVPLTVALVFDVSAGGDMLLVRPSIRTLADLAGKRIGVEPGALGALVLGSVLRAAGLERSAVTVVECATEAQLASWRQLDVDALVSYEPTATLLQREGAHRLFDSRQMPDTIVDVLAVHAERLMGRSDTVRAVVASHFRGLAHLQGNRQDAVYRIGARRAMAPQEVQLSLAGVIFPTLEANRQYLATQGRLHSASRAVSTLMVQAGLLQQADSLEDIGNATWLPRDDD